MRMYSRGFTLIELMIVVVIIAVLTSIAVPSYRQYAIRANRAEAKTMLLMTATNQERFYLQAYTYATDAQLTDPPPGGLGMRAESESGYYQLAITAADATSFVAVATAQAGQAEDEDCLVLAVDERGRRYGGAGPAPDFDGAGNNLDKCW